MKILNNHKLSEVCQQFVIALLNTNLYIKILAPPPIKETSMQS